MWVDWFALLLREFTMFIIKITDTFIIIIKYFLLGSNNILIKKKLNMIM